MQCEAGDCTSIGLCWGEADSTGKKHFTDACLTVYTTCVDEVLSLGLWTVRTGGQTSREVLSFRVLSWGAWKVRTGTHVFRYIIHDPGTHAIGVSVINFQGFPWVSEGFRGFPLVSLPTGGYETQ